MIYDCYSLVLLNKPCPAGEAPFFALGFPLCSSYWSWHSGPFQVITDYCRPWLAEPKVTHSLSQHLALSPGIQQGRRKYGRKHKIFQRMTIKWRPKSILFIFRFTVGDCSKKASSLDMQQMQVKSKLSVLLGSKAFESFKARTCCMYASHGTDMVGCLPS